LISDLKTLKNKYDLDNEELIFKTFELKLETLCLFIESFSSRLEN